MQGKFSKLFGIVTKPADSFDPAEFNDPIATQISWSPLKGGGASFRTRRLVQADLDRLEFRPTVGAMLFGLLFCGMGLAALAGGLFMIFSRGDPISATLMIFLIGSIFTAAGAFMIRQFSTPIVFDGRSGYFWKGRRSPAEVVNPDEIKHCAKPEEIHALQLISEYCHSDKNSYYSYELNLVLKSGERLNVFDHGHLKTARSDGEKLAEYLHVPLWHAIRR